MNRPSAAGMLEAERQFQRINDCRELAKLVIAIERELAAELSRATDREEDAIVLTA